MSAPASDRNLLFGIVALQLNFIDRDALITAMNAWALDKAKPLGQILQEQGHLPADRRQLLDALVEEHLKTHGGDAGQSLAALSSVESALDALRQAIDPDVQASIAHLGTASGAEPAADPEATVPAPRGGAAARYRILRPHA